MNEREGYYILITTACAVRVIAGLVTGEHWPVVFADIMVVVAYLHMAIGQGPSDPEGA